jgi:hypothetical protein
MPANTVLKLRAGTKSEWSATGNSKTVTSASVVVGTDTVARYSSTAHGFVVGNTVTVTGLTVTTGNNPYNTTAVVFAVATDTFDIKLTTGTTGGTTTTSGTAVLVVLAKGEAAVETDTFSLKIGDGTSAWADIPYVNKPFYYVLNSNQTIVGTTNEQNLFDNKIALLANTTYEFEIQCNILAANSTSKNFAFGFYQTGMTAFATTRFHWTLGTRADGTTHYSDNAHTYAGNSPVTSGLIDLYPADTNPVVFFNIKGVIRTGNGTSYFQPRIDWSTSPGSGTAILSGSYIKLDPLGPSSISSTGGWVAN